MEAYKPRRLKVVDNTLIGYTGMISNIEFENGISVDEVEWKEANRIGAAIMIVDADDETHQINEAAEIQRSRNVPADDERVKNFEQAFQTDGTTKLAIDHYTREELQEIADKSGLAGVRDLARRWGQTGRSINECIGAVLHAQSQELKTREEKAS